MWDFGEAAGGGSGGEEPGDWARGRLLLGAFGGSAGLGATVVELPAQSQISAGGLRWF